MPSQQWKERERRGARFFGAERNPGSGAHRVHSSSDSVHPILYIEQKYRNPKKSSGWWCGLLKFFKLEKEKQQADGKDALVIINHFNQQQGFLLTVHSEDWPIVVSEYLAACGYDLPPEDLHHGHSS